MTVGPILAGLGLLGLSRIGPGSTYAADILPPLLVFGFGLVSTVAPLTATALASAEERHAGIASGINNTVARVAGLLAVAGLPGLAGIGADEFEDPAAFTDGFRSALVMTGGLAMASGVIAFVALGGRPGAEHDAAPATTLCRLDAPGLRGPATAE
jgi:hypothetical protein